jgi:hypothetical protein
MEAIEVFTKFALQCLDEKDNKLQLREQAFGYFSEISKILKSEMKPILARVLEEILKTCVSEDGMKVVTENEGKKDFSLDSDSEEDGDRVAGIDIDTSFIDEKSTAIHALGNIFMNCSTLCFPNLPQILKVLTDMAFYVHENIRYHVCLTLTQIAFGLQRHFVNQPDTDAKFIWEAGLPTKSKLQPPVVEFLKDHLFPHFHELFTSEKNKEVVEKVLECVRDLAEEWGPAAIEHNIQMIMTTCD